MINSSIHTVELYKRVCYSEQLALSRTMKRLGVPSYSKGHGFIYVLEGRESAGITSIGLFSHYSKALGYNVDFHLEIALNPMRAVCDTAQKNAKAISPDLLPDALAEVLFSADQMFRLDLLDDVSLSRVDFCTDLKFDRQEQADEYIRLLKKVPCKRVLREVLHWDGTQRRWVPYSESKLVRCSSYEFQIYPKQPQILTRGLSGAEYAKGVVRIELRAGRKKLKSLHYKYAALLNPCENWCQELMVMAGLSGKIIEGMMIDMLGTGDFYPMKTILQKIDASGFYACTKQQMKLVLDYFPLHSSGEDALKHLGLSQKQWREVVNHFSKIGCCPIPIPTRACQPWYPGVTNWDAYFCTA